MPSIGDVCRRDLYSVRVDQTVLEVARYMAERNIGGVVVLDDDSDGGDPRLVGVFSERDLMTRVVLPKLDPAQVQVSRVMTPNPVVVDAADNCETSLRIMKQANCRHLPVVSTGKLVGMISMRDVLELELADRCQEAEMMRSYIHSIPPGRS